MTNDTLVKVTEKKYGGISIIAELLNRFTTLVDNWEVLNSQAMIAVAEKQRAEKEKAVILSNVEKLCRQSNLTRTGLYEIIRYLKESEDEILMSSGTEVSIHVQEIIKRIYDGLKQISEDKK